MMNTLRRKPRSRQASRPSLLSYHTQDSFPEREELIGSCGIQCQHNGTRQQCHRSAIAAGRQHSVPLRDISNMQYNDEFNNIKYKVPLNGTNIPYNLSVSNRNPRYNLPMNVKDIMQYNIQHGFKNNHYNVQQIDRAYHSQPTQYQQPVAEQFNAKKSRYDTEYDNRYQDYENVTTTSNNYRPQSRLADNFQYNNIQNIAPYNNDLVVPLTDPIDYVTRVGNNDGRYNHDQHSNPYNKKSTTNTSENTTTKEPSMKRLRTPSLSKQPSFRQYQIGHSTSSPNSISRTVEGVVKRRKHLVLLGLDGAGKTTILMRLKYRCYMATTPTVGFNHEKVWGGGYRWSAWDVGGGERVRPLWGTYSRGTDCVAYVVDATANTDTMEEARLELARIMKLTRSTALQMKRPAPPLLVMANFQDHSNARNAPEVAKCLGLQQEGAGAMSPCWAVACVCGVTGEGLDDALATLRQLIDKGARQNNKNRTRPLFI